MKLTSEGIKPVHSNWVPMAVELQVSKDSMLLPKASHRGIFSQGARVLFRFSRRCQ